MKMRNFQHEWRGGTQEIHVWPAAHTGEARAALLLVHGMAEHAARYKRLAERLSALDIAVYGVDLPGHGLSISENFPQGHFADKDGWNFALEAIEQAHDFVQREHPHTPIFLMGHSMGSFLAQHYVRRHSRELAGAVYSATTGTLGPTRVIGAVLMRAEKAIKGPRNPSALGEAMTFSEFNKQFKPARTDFDWLSRDPDEVDEYLSDPLCGFRVSSQLWLDLLAANSNLMAPAFVAGIQNKKLPVLMISGDHDPVCQNAKGTVGLAQAYEKAGLSDVTVSVFPNGRHELLNDICRDDVEQLLERWILNHCRAGSSK